MGSNSDHFIIRQKEIKARELRFNAMAQSPIISSSSWKGLPLEPDKETAASKKDSRIAAHVLVPYIRSTETFIYDRIVHAQTFVPAVLSDEPVRNIDMFPFKPIHTLADRPPLSRKAHHMLKRVLDYLPFFHEMIRRLKPRIIHAHYGPVGAALVGLRRKTGVPLVTSFYGVDASALLRQDYYKKLYARLWDEGDMISVLSAQMKQALMDAGCPEEKIRIHHLAVNTDDMQPRPDPGSRYPAHVLCAGRLVEKKGHHILLEALAQARRHADIQCDLAGEGPLESELKGLAVKLGIHEAVRFHGGVSRTRVLELMRGAHIFALLSRTAADGDMEGTPTALIEAGALGMPAVSTTHAGIPEIIEHGATGLLVPENEPAAAAAALFRLACDPDLRAQMGADARARIQDQFSIATVIRAIEADYESLIN